MNPVHNLWVSLLCSWTCVLSSNLPICWMGEKKSTSQKFWLVFFLIRKDEHLLIFLSTVWFCPLFSVVQLLVCFRVSATPWIAARQLPCLSPSSRVCSNSYLLRWWCHPAISSSVVHFVLQTASLIFAYLSRRAPDSLTGVWCVCLDSCGQSTVNNPSHVFW